MISRIKGTQDFLDLTLFSYTTSTIRSFLERYHFHEIATPIIESTELFQRSLGQETDVVSKEMFIIKSDKGMCLRPEATASTMRAYLENHVEARPWKVFSFGPMFRYERPQKGRFRQFHQVNIEVIGSDAQANDVQLITMLDRLFSQQFKLDTYALVINYLGTQEDRESFKKLLADFLDQHLNALCDTCKVRKEKNILRIFDCKNDTCKSIYAGAPKLVDNLSTDSKKEWELMKDQLHMLSVSYSVDPTLVRGLDYYDKIAFEFVSQDLGAQAAFCGGGRYNRLALELGAKKDIPSIGAAIGLERLLLLLEANKEKLLIPEKPALNVILPMTQEQEVMALLVADTLLDAGFTVETIFDEGSMKSMMRRANKLGAQFVLIIGPDEQAAGEVTLKNMQTSEEERIKQIALVERLKR